MTMDSDYLQLLKKDLYDKYLGSDSSDVDELNIVGDVSQEMIDQLKAEKRKVKEGLYHEEFTKHIKDARTKGVVNMTEEEMSNVVEDGTWEAFDIDTKGKVTEAELESTTKIEPEPDPIVNTSDVVYRNAAGEKVSAEEWAQLRNIDPNTGKKRRIEKPREARKEVEWNKGVAAIKEEAAAKLYEESVINEPFQRNNFTKEYDNELRNEVRSEDPLAFMFKKENIDATEGTTEKPKPIFTAPPNRFGLEAGYRWDGIVRGNGYEDKFLTAKSFKEERKDNNFLRDMEI